MSNDIKDKNVYKIISNNFRLLSEQDDDFGFFDLENSGTGGPGGRLGSPKDGDLNKPLGKMSDKPSTDDPRDPQDDGTTDKKSMATDPGNVPVPDADTSGEGEKVSPESEPEKGGAEEATPETPEEKEDTPGQAGLFTSKDFTVLDGATTSNVSTLNAKIQTESGFLTIINRGISPESDILDDDPEIVYTLVSKNKDKKEKRKNVKIKYSIVKNTSRNEHFAAVLDHLRGTHSGDIKVAGDSPPQLDEQGSSLYEQ